MSQTSDQFAKLAEDIRRQRDELALKLHLLKADAKDEWGDLEKKLTALESKLKVVGREAGDAAHEVGDALSLVADELKAGYARIRRLL